MIKSDWTRCYGEGWTGLIVPEAFAHPAKFSRALIRRIYQHALEEGWLRAGDTVLDPFAGVALGALHCMKRGINWFGVELENAKGSPFVDLGRQNLGLWVKKFAPHFRPWGDGVLVQGDSRELVEVIREAQTVVSSPPWDGGAPSIPPERVRGSSSPKEHGSAGPQYMSLDNPSNLGNLPAGDFEAVVASPPWGGQLVREGDGLIAQRDEMTTGRQVCGYRHQGNTEGQLAAMPEGDVDAVVSSPPYATETIRRRDTGKPGFQQGTTQGRHSCDEYGETDGQLGKMPEGVFDAAISSPPWENASDAQRTCNETGTRARQATSERGQFAAKYGKRQGQIGAECGETFWSAARQIVEQVYQVLVPGGHAIWVVKAFVRNKQLVDFPGQWQAMCEAVGFETLHYHRAWLVEDRGAQFALNGDLHERKVERKSFFRRLAEKKGSPRIDYEVVLCQRK